MTGTEQTGKMDATERKGLDREKVGFRKKKTLSGKLAASGEELGRLSVSRSRSKPPVVFLGKGGSGSVCDHDKSTNNDNGMVTHLGRCVFSRAAENHSIPA